jgi:hypothetical protein
MENMPRLPKRAVPERAVPRLSIPCHANNRKIAASSPHGHEKKDVVRKALASKVKTTKPKTKKQKSNA